jgi:hypothetical protein
MLITSGDQDVIEELQKLSLTLKDKANHEKFMKQFDLFLLKGKLSILLSMGLATETKVEHLRSKEMEKSIMQSLWPEILKDKNVHDSDLIYLQCRLKIFDNIFRCLGKKNPESVNIIKKMFPEFFE